jgi:hypothetical protein
MMWRLLMWRLLSTLAIVLIAAAQAVAYGDSLSAAPAISPQKGDRVRVEALGIEGIFVVEDIQPEFLVLRDPDGIMPQKVRIEDISSLAIGVPNSPARGAAHGAAIGALIGLLSGFVTGFAIGDDPGTDDNSDGDWSFTVSAEGKAWSYGGTLCAAGAFIGAIIGAGMPGERWESIPLDARLDAGAMRNGTVRIGVVFSPGRS